MKTSNQCRITCRGRLLGWKKFGQRPAVLTLTNLNAIKFRVKVRYRISIERGDLISELNFLWSPWRRHRSKAWLEGDGIKWLTHRSQTMGGALLRTWSSSLNRLIFLIMFFRIWYIFLISNVLVNCRPPRTIRIEKASRVFIVVESFI